MVRHSKTKQKKRNSLVPDHPKNGFATGPLQDIHAPKPASLSSDWFIPCLFKTVKEVYSYIFLDHVHQVLGTSDFGYPGGRV